MIGKLSSIFSAAGRGGDDSTIPGHGNPAASRVVKDYLAAMRVEQLEARIVPTQADPIFVRFCHHLYDYKRYWTPLGPIAIMSINDILSTYQSRATQIFESNFNSGAKWSSSTKACSENEKEILSKFPCFLISWSKAWGGVSTVCVIINRSQEVTEECRRKFSRKVNELYPGKAKVLWREVESEEVEEVTVDITDVLWWNRIMSVQSYKLYVAWFPFLPKKKTFAARGMYCALSLWLNIQKIAACFPDNFSHFPNRQAIDKRVKSRICEDKCHCIISIKRSSCGLITMT